MPHDMPVIHHHRRPDSVSQTPAAVPVPVAVRVRRRSIHRSNSTTGPSDHAARQDSMTRMIGCWWPVTRMHWQRLGRHGRRCSVTGPGPRAEVRVTWRPGGPAPSARSPGAQAAPESESSRHTSESPGATAEAASVAVGDSGYGNLTSRRRGDRLGPGPGPVMPLHAVTASGTACHSAP
jgi:hypothetical protein